ncbi:hypothetical protein M408DRAFT_331949 [Serendipita vermifera MAFF 305830]|uniref:Uncharacterized protein n=1 Tax=Serendipita vermifera MAFF 305830 TaxID=933852 RepID=A0A0C2X3T7_SERVB|nr:hypothetical protein M408DRAFT_331949 [Serendipita vermifera MAFF 305830]
MHFWDRNSVSRLLLQGCLPVSSSETQECALQGAVSAWSFIYHVKPSFSNKFQVQTKPGTGVSS